jgi:hypothetical protein
MIKDKFKECVALTERDVAEFEKRFGIAVIAQNMDVGVVLLEISASMR